MFQGKEKKWQQTNTMRKNALPSTLNLTAHNNKNSKKNYGKQEKTKQNMHVLHPFMMFVCS